MTMNNRNNTLISPLSLKEKKHMVKIATEMQFLMKNLKQDFDLFNNYLIRESIHNNKNFTDQIGKNLTSDIHSQSLLDFLNSLQHIANYFKK